MSHLLHQPVPTNTDTTLAWMMKSYGWRVELFWNSGGVWFTARLVDGDGNLMPRGDPLGVSAQSPGQALADLHDAVLGMGMNSELPGVNMYITTCVHGVDLRFTPRCYLCKPWDPAPLDVAPHPDEPHEFRTVCRRCGEPGLLHINIIAPGEVVTVHEYVREYAKEPQP